MADDELNDGAPSDSAEPGGGTLGDQSSSVAEQIDPADDANAESPAPQSPEMANENVPGGTLEAETEVSANDLVAQYGENQEEFRFWLNQVRGAFDALAPKVVQDSIHSVRSRLKDEDHLREKIDRKRCDGTSITQENLFTVIEDLAGMRVITLYRWDFAPIHEFVNSCSYWRVMGDPDAYAYFDHDIRRFEELGLKPKKKEKPYTSIHYVVAPPDKEWPRCEIQVRGLHLEGWGEVDHELRYPNRDPGPLATDVLEALHQAAAVTDWLSHLARRAADMHATLQKRELESAKQLEEISKLTGDLEGVSEAKKELERVVAKSRKSQSHGDAYLPLSGSFMGSVGEFRQRPTTGHMYFQGEKCELCKSGPALPFSVRELRTCKKCRKTFCRSCAADNSLVPHYAFALPQGSYLDGVSARRYARSELCKNCSSYAT